MQRNHLLEERIFSIEDSSQMEEIAFEVFHFQKQHCAIYAAFLDSLGQKNPTTLEEIPFLPISFFKHHRVSCGTDEELRFLSSGTAGQERSQHAVLYPSVYERSFLTFYEETIGSPKDQVILALLPNYIAQGNSSLVFMVRRLIMETQSELSGFILDKPNELNDRYESAKKSGKFIIIIGVSYALLDLSEQQLSLPDAIIIETGGMKGRRKELTKEALHQKIIEGTGASRVYSEYGMTELLSQGYSIKDNLFQFPKWTKVFIRDINDPFCYLPSEKTGGINIIDLANLYSCSFIATEDLGKLQANGLQLMGRFDLAELRGCNLMVQ